MANSYFAKYHARSGTMIGGVTKSQTSRFRDRKDAAQRLKDTIEINDENCVGEIVESNLPPEIFVHCGKLAQSVGGNCFRCGKVLTMADARATKDNFEIGQVVLIEPQMFEATVTHIFPDQDEVCVEIVGRKIQIPVDEVHAKE